MIIKANGHEVSVTSVAQASIQKAGKTYQALRFTFQGAITADDIAALTSGYFQIGGQEFIGYNTLDDVAVVVGQVPTAEADLALAQSVLGIITGTAELTPAAAAEQRAIIEQAVQALPDSTALQVVSYYPTWEDCVKKGTIQHDAPGFKFQHEGDLYACTEINPTFQYSWVPGIGTESLYVRIDEAHTGTVDDPIPYGGNMVLFDGLYYEQEGMTYLCVRDSGTPLYHALADLVGHYVQVA